MEYLKWLNYCGTINLLVYYSQTSTSSHLSTVATSLQWPVFLADSPYFDSCLNLSTTAISLQQPLSSVPQVAIVERFNCILYLVLTCGSSLYLFT